MKGRTSILHTQVEQSIVINIGIWNALSIVASIVLGAWYAAYRLARVETQVATLEANVSRLTIRVDKFYDGHSMIASPRVKKNKRRRESLATS